MRFVRILFPLICLFTMLFAVHLEARAQCCEVYKQPFTDYAPRGVPDFSQHQSTWGFSFTYTYCGPVALTNCLWWLDSRNEPSPVDPRPFSGFNNDNYPLVTALSGKDDHDTSNVIPFVSMMAIRVATDLGSNPGTYIDSMVAGTRAYMQQQGVAADFVDSLVAYPTNDYIRQRIIEGCNVILLLGFYDDAIGCCRQGGHYVTVAGVCTTSTQICVSDPWLDAHENEPVPFAPGTAHAQSIHNDADNISGPHGQLQHDTYTLTSAPGTCLGITVETVNYPAADSVTLANFRRQNGESPSCPPLAGTLLTVIEYAYVICPTTPVSVDDPNSGIRPERFELKDNYPNPFNAGTSIEYRVSGPGQIELIVYNTLGRQVQVLVQEYKTPGVYRALWNGRDEHGDDVPSGIYFYRLQAGDYTETRKMLFLK